MHTVVLNGKEYTKASVLAKRFNYTADYIGQLCRGGKVDAQLVGRSWYVHLDSLHTHRSGRYKKDTAPDEVVVKKVDNNYVSRIDVQPILNKKIVKILRETKNGLTHVPVRYESDDEILLPKIEKNPVYKSLPVIHADAERLKIQKKQSKSTLFKAIPPSPVVLSGSLSISDYPEVEEMDVSDMDDKQTHAAIKEPVAEIASKNRPISEVDRKDKRKSVVVKVKARPGALVESKVRTAHRSATTLHRVQVPTRSPIKTFKQVHTKLQVPHTPQRKKVLVPKSAKRDQSYWPVVLSIFLAILCSLLVVAIETQIVISAGIYSSKLQLNIASALHFFAS